MTKSITLLFPGQGSQSVGMGQKLEGHSSFELLKKADDVLGYRLSQLMLEGPEEELKLTHNAQPAILTYSTALLEKLMEFLKDKDIKINMVMGHSLGEYSALVAAKVLTFEEAVKAVHLRGKFMQEAVPAGVGKMIAIMKLSEEIITKACETVSTPDSRVSPANFNEPNQIVIAGVATACERAVKWLEENTEERFRAKELPVSAPFHSDLMKPAADKLAESFSEFNFKNNEVAYIANCDATEYANGTDSETIKKNLINQVTSTVKWTHSFQQIPSDSLCIEVGPGKVLTGLARKINPEITVIPLDKDDSFEALEEALKC